MPQKLKILFAAAEAGPLVKVGGLGDVACSLPSALWNAGYDIRVVLPKYNQIEVSGYEITRRETATVPFMGAPQDIAIIEISLPGGRPVYLIENEKYFARDNVYGEPDDVERFLFFSYAAMVLPQLMHWQPDIIHGNDWHTAFIAALLDEARKVNSFFANTASVLTIHNIAYQGWFNDAFARNAGLYPYMPPLSDPLRDRCYDLFALGIIHADVISTVSETYAEEILTPEYGAGLEGLIARHRDNLFGIRNGIDYACFDPATDKELAVNFDAGHIELRSENKMVLQRRFGLPVNAGIPLIAMVGRLVEQKGIDITVPAVTSLLQGTDAQFILSGSGETRYEAMLREIGRVFPGKARIIIGQDFALSTLAFSAADIVLVPSLYEPFGLAPIIAMRYGAVPVVRRTGGLSETVKDAPPDLTAGFGFAFDKYDSESLLCTVKRALTAYYNKDGWRDLVRRDMKADFSWQASLPKYESLYDKAKQHIG